MTLIQIELIVILLIIVWLIYLNISVSNDLESTEKRIDNQNITIHKIMELTEKLHKREREKWFNHMEEKGWKINYYTSPYDGVKFKCSVEKDGIIVEYQNQIV